MHLKTTSNRPAILACVVAAACFAQTPEQLSKAGAAALERRQYSEAERIYQQLVAMLPEVPEIQSNLGLARYFQHNFPGAETAFRSALRINPKLFVPNFFLGRMYFMASRHKEALPLLQRALETRQNERLVRQMLAAVYAGLGRAGDAHGQYAWMLKENPADIDALYGLGRTHMHLGRQAFERVSNHRQSAFYFLAKAEFEASRPQRFREAAEKYYRQAIEIAPTVPGLRLRLGGFLLSGGGTKGARAALEEEIRLDPYSYEARFLLSFAHLLEGETGAALRLIDEAARIRPEFFEPLPPSPVEAEKLASGRNALEPRAAHGDSQAALLLCIISDDPQWRSTMRGALLRVEATSGAAAADSRSAAKALFRRKRFEEGIAVLGRSPTSTADLRVELAWAYFHSKSLADVIRLLDERSLDDPEAAYLLGISHKQLAAQTLERLATLAPESARARELMGDSLYAREQYGEAVAEYEAALKVQPGDPELLFSLGNAHFKALEFERAADAYTMVLAVNPWHNAASHLKGRSLVLLNRPEEALPPLRKAVELDPQFKEAHSSLGQALAAIGNNEEAIKHLEAGAASDTDGSVHFQMFQVYRKLGNNAKAEEARKRSQALRQAAQDSDEKAR